MSELHEIAGRELRLSNLDKVLYPATGTTKGAVIEYYLAVAPVLLPLAEGRPVTRKRWVHGVGTAAEPGPVFFRKDLEDGAPEWVPRVTYQHKNSTNTYPLASEPAVLAWFAQLAALELHVPQWRFGPEGERGNPDRFVLDLDPGEGAGLSECVEVALLCKEILDDLDLPAVPVTSGSKGIHLYAKLDGTLTSDDASAFAKKLASGIESERPELATANMRKDLRRGKVLIDWSQNNAAKTTICPYSLRGRPRPMVAAPRTWEELAEPGLAQLSFRQVLERVDDGIDPMAQFVHSAGGAPLTGVAPAPSSDAAPSSTTAASTGAGGPNSRSRRRRTSRSAARTDGAGRDDGEPGEGDDSLQEYRAKRSRDRTPEPFSGLAQNSPTRLPNSPTSAPIFVIQRHDARRLHFDFRLERDGVLVSWAVPKGPPLATREKRLAVQTEDHPIDYATFAGQIPAGEYGAGTVEIWDSGTIEIEKWTPGKEVIVVLRPHPGGGLGGVARRYALIHTGGMGDRPAKNWLLHLMKNQPGGSGPSETSDQPVQAPSASARTASSGTRPDDCEGLARPMLATPAPAEHLGDGRGGEAGWSYEMKWDGIRTIAAVHDGEVRLINRRGNDVTATYPELTDLAAAATSGVVVDGEIVALNGRGVPDFGALQRRMNLSDPARVRAEMVRTPVYYLVFDLLATADGPLVDLPYLRRRTELFNSVHERGHIFLPPAHGGGTSARR